MPRFARSHFEREFACTRKFFNICAPDEDWHTESLCRARDKAFIGITATPAQLVIEMRRSNLPFIFWRERAQQVKQHHGIHAPRNRNKDFLAAPKKAACADGLFNLLGQITHGRMLNHPTPGAIKIHHAFKGAGTFPPVFRASNLIPASANQGLCQDHQ